MKIAFISIMEGYEWGGSEELWFETAIKAIEENHNVIVSYKRWDVLPPKIKELQIKGATVYLREKKYPSRDIFTRIKNRILKPPINNPFQEVFEKNPDVILINEGAVFNLILLPDLYSLLLSFNKPFYILSHQNKDYGVLPYNQYTIAKHIYLKAKKLFFVSSRNLEVAKRQLTSDLPNAQVVKNPVNLKKTTYIKYPETSEINLAYVGRLSCNQKAQELLFDVLRKDEWKNKKITVNLYGKGEDEQYLKDLAKYYNLKDKVVFKGFTKPDDIWKKNQALILTSLNEGMPIVIVEAMLAGRPVIVTDVAGNTEWVDDNVNGFVAVAPTVNEIHKTLQRAINNFSYWETMGQNAYDKAVKMFDKNTGKTLLDLITK